jgi:hypothetical protein
MSQAYWEGGKGVLARTSGGGQHLSHRPPLYMQHVSQLQIGGSLSGRGAPRRGATPEAARASALPASLLPAILHAILPVGPYPAAEL